ncbi:unnamed protein product [Thlaspi arvense]|uniref:Defensin n=1 Tax=Thlaspi arvense TaxID=13288 RepID=A0AAU9SLW7_THLAR|nr:unnamed protein product [Thlaspi arvense]
MAANKVAFLLVLCLCVLSTAEFGVAQIQTGRKCRDPDGVDKNGDCQGYCRHRMGFLGGSCIGYRNHFMCECYDR